MLLNKKSYTITTIINIVYLVVLAFNQDPFKENYSMMTSSLSGYIEVFVLCILLSLNFYYSYRITNNKYYFLAIGPIIGCIFPYYDGVGDIISNLHIIGAYIAFVSTCMGTIINIVKFEAINYKKGNVLLKIFVAMFFIAGYFYLQTLGVTSIQQLILLISCLLIDLYIVLSIKI